jgi:thioredoxin reductase (NADPH)
MDEKHCDLLIVGSGPAGMTAAIYASRAGLNTLILESTVAGGQILSTSEIDNFPGFISTSGPELAMKISEQVEKCGVETIYDEIVSLSFRAQRGISGAHKVICADTTITAKAVIIATGASPRKIGCEGEEKFIGAGVHFCALCDGAFYKDKDVVVAGGGNSAVEEVLYLLPIVKSITVINAFPNFNAFATLVGRLPKNLKVHHNTKITKILGGKKIEGIETSTGETINCSGIFVCIGRKPNTDFLGGVVNLTDGGYIAVNQKLETNVAGVYGAGDVCEKHVRQIVTACADGAIAATHAVEYINSMKDFSDFGGKPPPSQVN